MKAGAYILNWRTLDISDSGGGVKQLEQGWKKQAAGMGSVDGGIWLKMSSCGESTRKVSSPIALELEGRSLVHDKNILRNTLGLAQLDVRQKNKRQRHLETAKRKHGS